MTLTYSSTRAGLWRAYWRSLSRNRTHQLFWLVSVGGAFLIGTWLLSSPQSSGVATVPAGLAGAVGMAVLLALYPQLRFKPQPRTLTFTREEISTTIARRSRTYSWSQVVRFDEDDGFVLIALENLNAFVVPPTAFADADARRRFVEECEGWRRAAAKD